MGQQRSADQLFRSCGMFINVSVVVIGIEQTVIKVLKSNLYKKNCFFIRLKRFITCYIKNKCVVYNVAIVNF